MFCGAQDGEKVKNNMNKWHNFEPYCRKWVNLVLDAFLLNPTSCIMRLIFCSLQKVFVIRFCGICQLTFEYKDFLHMPGGWCWHSWILVTFKFPYMYTALMPPLVREEKTAEAFHLYLICICIFTRPLASGHPSESSRKEQNCLFCQIFILSNRCVIAGGGSGNWCKKLH